MTDSHISTIKGNRRPPPKVRRARIGSKSGAAFCTLTIDLFACIRHYFPRPGRTAKLRRAPHSENLTPPRISPGCPHCVIPRSRGAVAGQGYHCRQMRSWRNRLPYLLLDRWTRWAPYWPSLIGVKEKDRLLVSYRWSSRTVRIARSNADVI